MKLPAFSEMTSLVICGGAGGEASYLRKAGFARVVNSDFSSEAVARARERDPDIESLVINAQDNHLPDEAFDLVFVQDGLHHLPRPASGLNEMLRVAKRAVVVLEPHTGLVARLMGTKWEKHGETVNFVFRWNNCIFCQIALSQLLQRQCTIICLRMWDHSGLVYKVAKFPRVRQCEKFIAQFLYSLLTPFNFLGNSFTGIILKE